MGQDGEEAVESGDFQGVSQPCSSDSFRHITESQSHRVLRLNRVFEMKPLQFTDQETEVRKAKTCFRLSEHCW